MTARSRLTRRLTLLAAGLCLAVAGWQLAAAAAIPLKAQLAQLLLSRAWGEAVRGGDARPWPWADTRPVARLSVPRLEVEQFVLSGAIGRSLAFGPTRLTIDIDDAPIVLFGHRDTHFRFLKGLRPGDTANLTEPGGKARHFAVVESRVLHKDSLTAPVGDGVERVMLITCYPFDAVRPGGPLRYVVLLEAVADAGSAVVNHSPAAISAAPDR